MCDPPGFTSLQVCFLILHSETGRSGVVLWCNTKPFLWEPCLVLRVNCKYQRGDTTSILFFAGSPPNRARSLVDKQNKHAIQIHLWKGLEMQLIRECLLSIAYGKQTNHL